MRRDIPLRPSEGWLTVVLVVFVCLTLAWALDDAALVIGRSEYTDFLAWPAIAGALIAFVGAKAAWGRLTTFLVGGAFAALIVPLIVGTILVPGGAPLQVLYEASASAVFGAWRDLIILDRLSTQEYGHHLLILGLLVWGSSMFASYAAFAHRRPINGVMIIGVLLVGNMSFTVRDQLVYLVMFSVASLLLLIRFHTFEETSEWIRRRIGDPSAISGMYLRGGSVFITFAILGSLTLTMTAKSAPLASLWIDVGGRLVDWSRSIERFLPASGSGISLGPSFGSTAPIKGSWTTNNDPAMTIDVPTDVTALPHWAAVTYDEFDNTGWRQGQATFVDHPADTSLLAGTGDEVGPNGRQALTVKITPASAGGTVFAPSTPQTVDREVTVKLIGTAGYLASIERDPSKDPYTVTSLVPLTGDGPGASLTQNRLRAAGTDYPTEIMALYLPLPADAIGPESAKLLEEVKQAHTTNAFDAAQTIVAMLQDPSRFQYSANILDVDCSNVSVVECFARAKRGYCEYYASMMAVFMRELGYPTRFVEGYLPGTREAGSPTVAISNSQAHAWVEVYFPNYGWVTFDPTGGGVGQNPILPPGRPVASAKPGPSASIDPLASRPGVRRRVDEPPIGSTTSQSPGSTGPLIAVTLLLGALVAGLGFFAWQRGPRGPVSADGAYASVTRLAARLGFGPRPNQTVYEYAGALADVLPMARPELETVARAKVEVAYGGHVLGADRLQAIRVAERRLRVSLLRLIARRFRRHKSR